MKKSKKRVNNELLQEQAYEISNTVFIVKSTFKTEGKTISELLFRLICNDLQYE